MRVAIYDSFHNRMAPLGGTISYTRMEERAFARRIMEVLR